MNELQVKQGSPLAMASEFLKKDSDVDIDKLAKLLDIQERWEANEAKKAFTEAMAAFKQNPPKIFKDKRVKYKDVDYKHASLENVTATISEALSKHGLTASWVTGQADGKVSVTCRITHVFGHSEETSLASAPDASGSKNPIQAIGSAVSYLQRYTLLALTGLATEGQDDDGAGTSTKPEKPVELNDRQLEYIEKLRISLQDALDGKPVNSLTLKGFLLDGSKKTGKSIPEDDTDLPSMVKYILQKKQLIANLTKGAAA